MFMFKLRWYVPLAIMILICIVGVIRQLATPPEPIKIYKAVEPISKTSQDSTYIEEVPPSDISDSQSVMSHSSGQSDTVAIGEKYETDDSESVGFSEAPETEEQLGTDESESESETEYQKLAQELVNDWNIFADNLSAKYNMLFDLEYLDAVSQTPDGRREIVKQAKAMQDETLDYVVSLFDEIPYEDKEEVLRLSEQHLRNSNTGLSDKHISQSFEMIRARVK